MQRAMDEAIHGFSVTDIFGNRIDPLKVSAPSADNKNMDTTVTLKLSPREFDLIRCAVKCRQSQQEERGQRKGADIKESAESIRESRAEAVELRFILENLNGKGSK